MQIECSKVHKYYDIYLTEEYFKFYILFPKEHMEIMSTISLNAVIMFSYPLFSKYQPT